MSDFSIRVAAKVDVSKEDIDDIMVAALEGGINYWCCKAEVVGEYLGEYASEQISRGGMLKLYDREEDDTYLLTLQAFLCGLTRYLSNPRESGFVILPGKDENTFAVDVGNIDADAADQIIQYGIFGEIVYA